MPIDWKRAQRSSPASTLAGTAPELLFWGFALLREQQIGGFSGEGVSWSGEELNGQRLELGTTNPPEI